MSRLSINGLLKPKDKKPANGRYLGHFIKVSYIQEIAKQSIYGKDRFDVNDDGSFRFFLPKAGLVSGQSITLELYAPDGELMGRQVYSYGSLQAADIDENSEDNSAPMVIEIDPKVVTVKASAEAMHSSIRITGKVIDSSGKYIASGLQVVIMTSQDPDSGSGNENFNPVFSVQTDSNGSFYARVEKKSCQQAYGLIAGVSGSPVFIKLESGYLPESIILVADLSELPAEAFAHKITPALPDSSDMTGNSTFSQDLGGTCVDFTVPNRTLEEFSFYHTVRTTEPEIKGITLSSGETRQIRAEFYEISDGMFGILKKVRESMNTVSVSSFTLDEESQEEEQEDLQRAEKKMAAVVPMNEMAVRERNFEQVVGPVFRADVKTKFGNLKITTADLFDVTKKSPVKAILMQQQMLSKFEKLRIELVAAYCGKNGAQEELSFCESVQSDGAVNVNALSSLFGHVSAYIKGKAIKTARISDAISEIMDEFDEQKDSKFISDKYLKTLQDQLEYIVGDIIDHEKETSDREEILGYLRRIIKQLSSSEGKGVYTFEPCPTRKTRTVGIMCMINQYEEKRDKIRNTAIFSLGDILSIRESYDSYIVSVDAFLILLEKFYNFYQTNKNSLVSVQDDYFITNYATIHRSLSFFKTTKMPAAIKKIERIEQEYLYNHPGRKQLSVENSIDWDDTPTVYHNTTIAHGHILHFKQKWKADGYSLGDLLYSLPLAPCQEKQIAIIDWDREENARRSEYQNVSESLSSDMSHNRDISEIMNSSFRENINANSYNKTKGRSAGIGGGLIGGIGGIFGGASSSGSSSRSTAHQDSARNLSGSTLNRVRDNVSQSASSLRNQRSTVVQTVGQNEDVMVQTEVIKNNNHCHAMTVEYFEVLKHYAVEQELADVQECLYVPLPVTPFDYAKVLRWKNTLLKNIWGNRFRRGFAAIERITSNYMDSDFPAGSYADETIDYFEGFFNISFEFQRPQIAEIDEATKTEQVDLRVWFPWCRRHWLIFPVNIERPLTEADKDAMFEAEYAPEIARDFIDTMDFYAVAADGTEKKVDLDVTLLSHYRRGRIMQVKLASRDLQNITRREFSYIKVSANTQVQQSSKIILRSLHLSYRNAYYSGYIVRKSGIMNDVINVSESGTTDAALIYTPMNTAEKVDPRKRDREDASALLDYLNEHLELAHSVIWSNMDSNRLFSLLDGFIAPNSGNRSVASVVENNVMGVIGNNLVLKVVPGERLDPVFRHVDNLLDFYQTASKPDPYRISVPTKGVYAEAVMGKCNSCETIDESRHWRFDAVPCGYSATPISDVSAATRRTESPDLQPKDFPGNIINMQTAPGVPDPTGLGAAFELLGKAGVFTDMTGLEGTQNNALQALQTASSSANQFASLAANSDLQKAMKKDISSILDSIDKAQKAGQLTKEQANELTVKAFNALVGDGVPAKAKTSDGKTGGGKTGDGKTGDGKTGDGKTGGS